MSTLIKLRRDTAANWAAIDPVLQLGEPGYDTTNNELRIGDGTTPWSGLTPIAGGGGGGYGDANVATFLANFGSNTVSTTGNITATNFIATEWVYGNVGVDVSQIQMNDGVGNSINLLNSSGSLVYESSAGTDGGFIPASPNTETIGRADNPWATVYANAFIGDGSQLTGISGSTGNLSITGTTIGIAGGASETTITMGSNVAAVTVDTDTGAPVVSFYAQSTDFQGYSQGSGDYSSGEWVAGGGGGQINITGVQSYFQDFLNNLGGYAQITIDINGTDTVPYDGWSGGGGSVSLFTTTAPVTDPTAVTSIGFNLTFNNGILLDPDEGDMLFRIGDFNLNINSQRDINITSGDDLRLLGNDIARLAGNAEVTIVSNFNTDPNYTWTFNTDGNLILPGSGAVSNPINSSLDPLNPNVSTMVLTPDVNYGFQALVLDPTAPGHIHLRAPSGGGNIDQPAANIFLGGEQSSFEVGASYGDAPNVFVRAGGNTWTFDNTGVVTLPNGGVVDNTDNNIELRSSNNVNFEATNVVNIYTDTSTDGYQWQFDDAGALVLAPIPTGEGVGESARIRGSRTIVGGFDNPLPYVVEIPGHTEFGNVAWTASSGIIQSAKITFVVQSGGSAFQWEQFDVSVCKLDGANAFVTVSNRIKQNSSILDTEVEAYDGEGGLEVWLNPADGQTIAYVNYSAVEFGLMYD